MPFFRDTVDVDGEEVVSAAPRPATAMTQPLPIHGTDHTTTLRYRPSEESIRTELCEGLLLPDPQEVTSRSPESELQCATTTSNRAELIERLKRGESPTWIPSRRHETFLPGDGFRDLSPMPRPQSRNSPGLLTYSLSKERNETDRKLSQDADTTGRTEQGLSIERPRSALHSGDFTQNAPPSQYSRPGNQESAMPEGDAFDTDRQSSWLAISPPRDFTALKFDKRMPFPDLAGSAFKSSPPSRSSSLSSSFVYKHPTSPLVQSEINDDLSVDAMALDHTSAPSRSSRRQTLPSLSHHTPATAQRIPSIRKQSRFPYQAHQPRRSLTSAPTLPLHASSPSAPFSASARRPSIALDASPLQQTSMVGSYEESILRGRMSTSPSKPLDFIAQIGVLGLGASCKPSLKCPAHVTLPFSAVFYSYGGGGGGSSSSSHGRASGDDVVMDDGPSPYVGQIDLENGLPNPEAASKGARRRSSRQRSGSLARSQGSSSLGPDSQMTGVDDVPAATVDPRGFAKSQRRRGGGGSGSPKAPPGGSYRISEKGQLQIIIKNQNKTAVKLFLVPYDLTGMEPGTKTFIRQRAYSSMGPVPAVDAATTNVSEDGKGSARGSSKQVLRYLVHLHICCPARGRHYLYKSVRVVFANRVPDGTERLRNEISLPEPRFTPYKPVRQMAPPPSAAEADGRRRRSNTASDFSFGGGGGGGGVAETTPGWDEAERRAVRGVQQQQDGRGAMGGLFVARRVAPPVPAGAVGLLNFAKGGLGRRGAAGTKSVTTSERPHGEDHLPVGGVDSGAATAEGLLSLRLRSLGMQGVCLRGAGEEEDGTKERR